MFIRAVDQALERMVREQLPLRDNEGDVTFDSPTSTWAAQLSQLTVNFFLCDIGPSGQSSRSPRVREDAGGRAERRRPQPMMRLAYLVSAWAGSAREEHQLLGDVLSMVAGVSVLPAEWFSAQTSSSVSMTVVDDLASGGKLRDMWTSAGGQLKASFLIELHVAADTYDWVDRPPLVRSLEGSARNTLAEPAGVPSAG